VLAVLAFPPFLPHLDVLHTNLGCIREEYKDLHMAQQGGSLLEYCKPAGSSR
jgi:hypothetical protein